MIFSLFLGLMDFVCCDYLECLKNRTAQSRSPFDKVHANPASFCGVIVSKEEVVGISMADMCMWETIGNPCAWRNGSKCQKHV